MYELHLKQYTNLNISNKGKQPLKQWLRTNKYNLSTSSGIHLKWITWLLSGHSPLAYFQHKSGQVESPDCKHCPGYPETSEHFLAECVGYATIRLNTLGYIHTTLDHILKLNTRKIIDFINKSGRLDNSNIFI